MSSAIRSSTFGTRLSCGRISATGLGRCSSVGCVHRSHIRCASFRAVCAASGSGVVVSVCSWRELSGSGRLWTRCAASDAMSGLDFAGCEAEHWDFIHFRSGHSALELPHIAQISKQACRHCQQPKYLCSTHLVSISPTILHTTTLMLGKTDINLFRPFFPAI